MNCIDFSKLSHIPLTGRIYSMIRAHDTEDLEENDQILDQINNFHNITLLAIRQAFSLFPRKYAENKTDGRQANVGKVPEVNETIINANLELYCPVLPFLLDYQASVLMLLNMQLKMGLADSSLIKAAMECAGLVLKADLEKVHDIDKSSILCFFKYCRKKTTLRQSFQKLLTVSLNLLQTLLVVRRHYQITALLKLWAITEDIGMLEPSLMQETVSEIFSIFGLSSQTFKNSRPLSLALMNKNFVRIVEEILPEENQIRKSSMPSQDLSFHINGIEAITELRRDIKQITYQRMPVDLILIENLFRESSSKEFQFYQPTYSVKQDSDYIRDQAFQASFAKRICNTVMANLDQRQQAFQLLTRLVIFQGSVQRRIYRVLNYEASNVHLHVLEDEDNESVPGSDRDAMDSPQLVPRKPQSKFNTASPYLQKNISIHYLEKVLLNLKRKSAIVDPKDLGYRLKVGQAKEELLRTVTALTEYLQESYNLKLQFTKTQNLMRNLGFGRVMISILSDSGSSSLISACMNYLHYFSYLNRANLAELAPHLELLLGYALDHSEGVRLVVNLIKAADDQQTTTGHLKNIFYKVVAHVSSEGVADYVNLGGDKPKSASKPHKSAKKMDHLITFMKILSRCSVDSYGKPQKDNQVALLGLLINSPELARIYESQFFFSVRKFIQKKLTGELTDSDNKFMDFYLAALSLIADLGRMHTESKEQAKRICEAHILLEYLLSKKPFFLLKREILKLYHYVSIILLDIPRE